MHQVRNDNEGWTQTFPQEHSVPEESKGGASSGSKSKKE